MTSVGTHDADGHRSMSMYRSWSPCEVRLFYLSRCITAISPLPKHPVWPSFALWILSMLALESLAFHTAIDNRIPDTVHGAHLPRCFGSLKLTISELVTAVCDQVKSIPGPISRLCTWFNPRKALTRNTRRGVSDVLTKDVVGASCASCAWACSGCSDSLD